MHLSWGAEASTAKVMPGTSLGTSLSAHPPLSNSATHSWNIGTYLRREPHKILPRLRSSSDYLGEEHR